MSVSRLRLTLTALVTVWLVTSGLAAHSEELDSAMIAAIHQQDADAVWSLLARGAAADLRTDSGRTALMVAAQADHLPLGDALLAAGLDVDRANDRGGTALMFAAVAGSVAMVELLVTKGADVNKAGNNGWTALMLAAVKNHDRIVSYLVAHGADPNMADMYGSTALSRAAEEGRLATAKVLIKTPRADLDSTNDWGATPLHYAAAAGDAEICRLLLAHGADSSITDSDGRTPLAVARSMGHAQVVELLSDPR